MKRLLTFCVFFLCLFRLHAQNNIGTTYCNHNDLNASKYQPSELDLGDKHVQIGFNYYLWMGNTTFDYKTVNDIYRGGNITNEDISHLTGKLKKTNTLGIGQDYQVLGIGFQVKSKGGKKYDVSLSLVDKFAMSFIYTDNFMKLALKGNKQFAGERTSLGPMSLNANYSREYVVGTAFPLIGDEKSAGIRLGLRGKFIQGLGAMYMPKGEAYLTTDAEGRYLELEYDYEIHMSGLKEFSLFKYNGAGYGLDAGLTFFLGKNLELVASILDVGNIHYTQNTSSYEGKGKMRYEGMIIGNLFGDQRYDGDSLAEALNPVVIHGRPFRMPLGTKIALEAEIKTPKIGRDDREYVSNAIFLTYIQGLNNMPGATTRPFMAIGYNHDFHRVFDGGFSASMGGFNKLAFGTFFSLKFGTGVKWGFSSDNLTAFILPGYGTGIDFSTNFSVSF